MFAVKLFPSVEQVVKNPCRNHNHELSRAAAGRAGYQDGFLLFPFLPGFYGWEDAVLFEMLRLSLKVYVILSLSVCPSLVAMVAL